MKPEVKTVNNTDVIVGFEPNRDILTTFSRDKITRKRLNLDVFYDDGKYFVKSNSELHRVIEMLADRFLLIHTGDDGEFISEFGKSGYGEGELSLIDLEPNNSVTVTTQFDIPYDDQMKYSVGIIPDRYGLQDYQERGFVCVKNC